MAIINPRIESLDATVGVFVAETISDDMQENTLKGHGFGNDEYDNVYSELSIQERESMGLQTSTVELRRGNNRIEHTRIDTSREGTVISFQSGGKIFKQHHTGKPYTGTTNPNIPVRSIFPKTIDSVPTITREDAKTLTGVVLSGGTI